MKPTWYSIIGMDEDVYDHLTISPAIRVGALSEYFATMLTAII